MSDKWHETIDVTKYSIVRKPMANEVCKALSKHLEVSVSYDKESRSFYTTTYFEGTKWAQTIIEYFTKGYIQIHGILPPKLVNMISRFYEGLEE